MDHVDLETRTSRSGIYELLSRLWLTELSEPQLEQLRTPNVRSAFEAAGGYVPSLDDLEALAIEYCGLFVGPKHHLPPLQSVWDRGELQSDITTSVREFADALGYPIPPSAMWDQLGCELGIMGRALQVDGDQRVQEEFTHEFFRRHLCWTSRFLSEVEQRSTSEFYRSLANMTQEFLRGEQARYVAIADETSGKPSSNAAHDA